MGRGGASEKKYIYREGESVYGISSCMKFFGGRNLRRAIDYYKEELRVIIIIIMMMVIIIITQ